MADDRSRVERFLDWADARSNGATPRFQTLNDNGNAFPITAVWYPDCPERDWGLGLTYETSLLTDPGVELLISIKSPHPHWAWALAHFVDTHRAEVGQKGQLGLHDTINWQEPIAPDTEMNALLIVAPTSMPAGETAGVHLAATDHVSVLQVIPIFASEIDLVRRGPTAFLAQLGDTSSEPSRRPLL